VTLMGLLHLFLSLSDRWLPLPKSSVLRTIISCNFYIFSVEVNTISVAERK
jgi:hypothetical protein